MKIGNGNLFFNGEYQTENGEYISIAVHTESAEEITEALDSAFGYSGYNARWTSSNISRIAEAQALAIAEQEAKAKAKAELALQSLAADATFDEDKSGKFAIVGNYRFDIDKYTGVYKCRLSVNDCTAAVENYGIGNLYHSYGVAVTQVTKAGGWVEHRVYEAWRLPVKNRNEILLFCNGVQRH